MGFCTDARTNFNTVKQREKKDWGNPPSTLGVAQIARTSYFSWSTPNCTDARLDLEQRKIGLPSSAVTTVDLKV
eukprot:1194336-Prorocentrum_minimum.AAC.9